MSLLDRLRAITPFGDWKLTVPAAGVGEFERIDKFEARVLTDTASVHIHYFVDDNELARQGWGYVHLVCHGCNAALKVTYPAYNDADLPDDRRGLPKLRAVREAFSAEHAKCWALGNEMLCPPQYVVTSEIDLRLEKKQAGGS